MIRVGGVEGLKWKGVRGTLCRDRICVLVKTYYRLPGIKRIKGIKGNYDHYSGTPLFQ